MSKVNLFLILLILYLSGCKHTSEPDIEKILTDVTTRFPQLPKGKSKLTDFYKLDRELILGKKGLEIQLRSTPDSIQDKQQIVIIIDTNGKYAAIPFFSNTYRDYWDFRFDTILPQIPKTNTTFQKELDTVLKKWHSNDRNDKSGIIMNELLLTILQCERISADDTNKLKQRWLVNDFNLPEENDTIISKRLRKSYNEIINQLKPFDKLHFDWAYLDNNNNRVYLFHNKSEYLWKLDLEVKVYRYDYVKHIYKM